MIERERGREREREKERKEREREGKERRGERLGCAHPREILEASTLVSHCSVQGYLAHKKPRPRTP